MKKLEVGQRVRVKGNSISGYKIHNKIGIYRGGRSVNGEPEFALVLIPEKSKTYIVHPRQLIPIAKKLKREFWVRPDYRCTCYSGNQIDHSCPSSKGCILTREVKP